MNSWECKGSKLIFLQFLFLKSFSLITSNFTNYQWHTTSSKTTKNIKGIKMQSLICNFRTLKSFCFLKKLVWTPCTLISWKIGGSFSTWSAINSRVPQHSVIHSFLAPLITEQLQFFFNRSKLLVLLPNWTCAALATIFGLQVRKTLFFQVGHRWLLSTQEEIENGILGFRAEISGLLQFYWGLMEHCIVGHSNFRWNNLIKF